MKIRIKKRLIAEHNARYEAQYQQRKSTERYVALLKAPKYDRSQTS